uniref:Ovule protein n=1 Tax=Steinernema glaseri TaxID=37863 RepID=A0A1I7YIK9_9BILA
MGSLPSRFMLKPRSKCEDSVEHITVALTQPLVHRHIKLLASVHHQSSHTSHATVPSPQPYRCENHHRLGSILGILNSSRVVHVLRW